MTIVIASGVSVVIPAIPNIMRNYGVGPSFITAAFVTLLIGRFLSSIFAGQMLLKLFPHQLLFYSFILHTLTMISLAFTETGLWFAVLRFFEGIFEGIVSVTLQELVIGLSTREDRGVKMGYMQSAIGMGFILGPVIGSISMKLFGAQGVFGVTAGLMCLCIIWLSLIYRRINQSMQAKKAKVHQLSFSWSFIKYLPFYGGPLLQRLLMVAFAMLLPLYLVDRLSFLPHQVGFYFTMSAIITTSTMPFTGRLSTYSCSNYIIVAAMLIMGLSILGMGFTTSRATFTALFIIETIGFSIMTPNAMKIFGDKISNHVRRGEIVGASSSLREVINILLAFCLIPIYEFNVTLPWVILSVLCFLLSVPYLSHEATVPTVDHEGHEGLNKMTRK